MNMHRLKASIKLILILLTITIFSALSITLYSRLCVKSDWSAKANATGTDISNSTISDGSDSSNNSDSPDSSNNSDSSDSPKQISTSTECKTLFKIDNLHNGDVKFYDNKYIVGNDNGTLGIFDFNGQRIRKYDDIKLNWLSVENTDNIIIYANSDKEVGILKLDDSLNIILNEIIMRSDKMTIDPTILKINDTYFITVTTINGTINNSNPDKDNGIYSVDLYKSKDLLNWTHMDTIIKDNHNIEDLVAMNVNGTYYIFFEREVVDKGNSSLEVIFSNNKGIKWTSPKILCKAEADNELGNIIFYKNKFILYYSSDYLNKGTSYEGASIFVKYFDQNFENASSPKVYREFSSTLLFDVLKSDDSLYIVYNEHYMTQSNMVLAQISPIVPE